MVSVPRIALAVDQGRELAAVPRDGPGHSAANRKVAASVAHIARARAV